MKKLLTHNIGLKILAVLTAFVVWLVVVNYDDPVKTASFSNIPIIIKNADSLREKGKVFEVKNGLSSIDVTITAKRTILDTLSAENIIAEADVSNLSIMNTVTLNLSTNKNNAQIDSIKTDTPTLELLVENLKEISLPINVDVTGEPAGKYVVGDISYATNTVRVSGPESVVNNITSARCSISVDGRTSDISSSLDINLYDENGDKVEHDNVRKNISTINVTVAVVPTKVVPVRFEYSGVPADSFVIKGNAESNVEEVTIAGRSKVINNISVIWAGSKDLNVDKRTESLTGEVDIANYMPDGAKLVTADGFDGIAKVTINIEEYVTESVEVPFSSFGFHYLPEGYKARIVNERGEEEGSVTMKFQGMRSEMDKLDVNKYVGDVLLTEAIGDMKLKDEFTVTANVDANYVDADIYLLEADRVRVKVYKNDED